MTVTVKGAFKLQSQLRKMAEKQPIAAKSAVKNVMEEVAEKANENLLNKIGSRRTPRGYRGHGDPLHEHHLADDKDDMGSWVIDSKLTNYGVTVKLTNICEHAAAVEYGVNGTIRPSGRFLVLGYEGGVKDKTRAILKKEVQGQKGYGFLSDVLNDQSFMKLMNRKLNIQIMRELRR